MKRMMVLAVASLIIALFAGTASAESIKNRFGITGQLGFMVPSDSEVIGGGRLNTISSNVAFIGGGGLIYGLTDSLAAELNVTHASYDSDIGGFKLGDFGVTAVTIGGQYRFDVPIKQLVPYAGAGVAILLTDLNRVDGIKPDVDTTAGGYAVGGVDYFIMNQLALNAEIKGVLAQEADIMLFGGKIGNYKPSSFSTLFGVRVFFN